MTLSNQIKILITVLFIGLSFQLTAAEGDMSSADLTGQAWGALGGGNANEAIKIADQCISLFEKDAMKMQKKLKGYAEGAEIDKLWALNDVGTCYFIKAKALISLDKKSEAKKVLEHLTKKLKYSQCWDPEGWYWYPAEAAAEELASL